MNSVSCPLCGRENSEQAEICQFCQARLKPLHLTPQSPSESLSDETSQPNSAQPFDSAEETPEWLADLRGLGEGEPAGEPNQGPQSDWLRGFRNQVNTNELKPEPQPFGDERTQDTSPPGGQIPPWLDELRSQAIGDPGGLSSEPAEIAPETEFDHAETSQEPMFDGDSASGMLRRIIGSEEQEELEKSPENGTKADLFERSESLFGDYSDLHASTDVTRQPAEITGEELPTWLEDLPASTVKDQEPITGSSAAKSELPGWLELMRPVESAELPFELPEEIRSHVETVGPLAGLSGILPAEPEISISRKPAVYAMKLQVSESQQEQAKIFEQTIKSETTTPALEEQILAPVKQILRLVFALILLTGILAPVFSFYPQVQLPPLIPPEVLSVSQIVSGLPPGSPILIAIEYEPGYSGEMDAALGAVIDHLMIQGSFLAFISTSGMGPMQAEHLVAVVNQSGSHGYSDAGSPPDYINLGFLSGGKAGLRRFAENPQEVIYDGNEDSSAWEKTPLPSINSLNQFALVLVATENFDKARDWIEQVQPLLEDTPMVFVTSSQSEPTIRPYYQSRPQQVQGIVSGLTGGAYYGNSIGRSGIAHRYWPSFNSAVLVVVALIVLGGGINAIKVMLESLKKPDSGRKGA